MAYDRTDTQWLYRYYSGDRRDDIAASIFRCSAVINNRIRTAGLPGRPRGHFSERVKREWLQRPEIVALRERYAPTPAQGMT
jgi:hypothetical protein